MAVENSNVPARIDTPAPADYLALAKMLESTNNRLKAISNEYRHPESKKATKLSYEHERAIDALRAIYGMLS